MNIRGKRLWILFLIFVVLFSGCGKSGLSDSQQSSEVWKDIPQLHFGTLEYEKLSKLPWSSGRGEATGYYRIAETGQGYYFYDTIKKQLLFADKEDMSHWVTVCAKPNCKHASLDITCDGAVSGNSFVLRDNRIYFSDSLSSHRHLYPGTADGMAIFSKAFDGSDIRLEYVIEEGLIQGGGRSSNYLTADQWVYNVAQLQKDGTCLARVYRRTEEKLELLFEETLEDFDSRATPVEIGGDRVHYNGLLGSPLSVQRSEDGKLVTLELGEYRETACYLSGDILRIFRPNDGYYDVNLATGEEVFVCKAQLENSVVAMPLPNCIIETTIGSELHPEGEPHAMAFFDGESWHNLSLPEELTSFTGRTNLALCSVTSDSVMICVYQIGVREGSVAVVRRWDAFLYRIPIGEKKPSLEYLATIEE